jgi:hypothetical protein
VSANTLLYPHGSAGTEEGRAPLRYGRGSGGRTEALGRGESLEGNGAGHKLKGSGLIPQNIAGDGKSINEPARGLGFGTGEEER